MTARMTITADYRLATAVMLAALLLAALTVPAARAEDEPSRATLINTCVQDVRNGVKAGHVLSNSQRMMAEEQCRAYADAEIEKRRSQSGDASRADGAVEAVKTATPIH